LEFEYECQGASLRKNIPGAHQSAPGSAQTAPAWRKITESKKGFGSYGEEDLLTQRQ